MFRGVAAHLLIAAGRSPQGAPELTREWMDFMDAKAHRARG